MSKFICIAGGGTGGHVMPALALCDAMRLQWKDVTVKFIGAERGLEATLLPQRGEDVFLLSMHAVQGVGLLQKLRVLLWELPQSVLKVKKLWKTKKPDVVVGVGGYASVAAVVAALISRIPVVLYEQNAIPGLVNRMLHRFATRMMLGFTSTRASFSQGGEKLVVTGNVIRPEVLKVKYQTQTMPCLLIVGGSQGAMFLNETVPLACKTLKDLGRDFTVIHLVGKGEGRVAQVAEIYKQAGIEAQVLNFSNDMPSLFAQASLMVARAGAMTVCEAAAIGMPAFFVPLPSAADNHQYFNALAMKEVGGAEIIAQQSCDARGLAEKIGQILFDAKKLKQMSDAARSVAIVDAGVRQVAVLDALLLKKVQS